MKKFLKIAGAMLAVYLLLSVVASVLVSTAGEVVSDWIIENRAPLLVVSVDRVTLAREDVSGDVYGPDHTGRKIYGYSPADAGREKITVFAWEPFNNYYDATFLRLDF